MKKRKGLTLVEVLFSIVMLACILGATVPNFIKSAETNDILVFREEMKHLSNVIEMTAETTSANNGHYPHPLYVDYQQFALDDKTGLEAKGKGIPYDVDNASFSDTDNFIEIQLATNTGACGIGGAKNCVVKYKNGEVSEQFPNILPEGLYKALVERFNVGSQVVKLKTYPIDLKVLERYSENAFTLTFPKKTNVVARQTGKTLFATDLRVLFPGNLLGNTSTNTTAFTNKDKNDDIPGDKVVQIPGFYFMVANGNIKTVVYTGTDIVFEGEYQHLANF